MTAKSSDLMGLGMSAALARLIGKETSTVTCAGTTAGAATLVTTRAAELQAASSQTGAILPAIGSSGLHLFVPIFLYTTSSTSAVVYPPTGATINGASSLTIAQNKAAIIIPISPTVFIAILTA